MKGMVMDFDDGKRNREKMLSRLADMTDEEVLRRAESDPDCRPLSEEQLAHMVPLRERSSAKQ